MRSIHLAVAAVSALIAFASARAEEPIIHPLCVQQLAAMVDFHFVSRVDAPLPAAACNRSFSATPVDIQGDVASAEVPGASEPRAASTRRSRTPTPTSSRPG